MLGREGVVPGEPTDRGRGHADVWLAPSALWKGPAVAGPGVALTRSLRQDHGGTTGRGGCAEGRGELPEASGTDPLTVRAGPTSFRLPPRIRSTVHLTQVRKRRTGAGEEDREGPGPRTCRRQREITSSCPDPALPPVPLSDPQSPQEGRTGWGARENEVCEHVPRRHAGSPVGGGGFGWGFGGYGRPLLSHFHIRERTCSPQFTCNPKPTPGVSLQSSRAHSGR